MSVTLINNLEYLPRPDLPKKGLLKGLLKGITSRMKSAVSAPGEIVRQAAFSMGVTTGGFIGTGLSVLSFGRSKKLNHIADVIDIKGPDISSHRTISAIYAAVIDIFQPGSKKAIHENLNENEMGKTRKFGQKIFDKADDYAHEGGFFRKYVFSRALYGVAGLAALVTRTVDLIFGLIAATASFLLLGQSQRLNKFVARNLTFTGIFSDGFRSIRGMVNPQQYERDPKPLIWYESFEDVEWNVSFLTSGNSDSIRDNTWKSNSFYDDDEIAVDDITLDDIFEAGGCFG